MPHSRSEIEYRIKASQVNIPAAAPSQQALEMDAALAAALNDAQKASTENSFSTMPHDENGDKILITKYSAFSQPFEINGDSINGIDENEVANTAAITASFEAESKSLTSSNQAVVAAIENTSFLEIKDNMVQDESTIIAEGSIFFAGTME